VHNWETRDPYVTAWIRLRQASDAVVRVTEIELNKTGTTLAQLDVLLILSMSRVPLSPGEIAAYVGREKHSTSALLSRMQRAGYVKKVRSKKDQRVVKIQIQPKGIELLNQSAPVIVGYARDLLRSNFSEADMKQLDWYMKTLRDLSLLELGTKAQPLPATIEIESWPFGWQPTITLVNDYGRVMKESDIEKMVDKAIRASRRKVSLGARRKLVDSGLKGRKHLEVQFRYRRTTEAEVVRGLTTLLRAAYELTRAGDRGEIDESDIAEAMGSKCPIKPWC